MQRGSSPQRKPKSWARKRNKTVLEKPLNLEYYWQILKWAKVTKHWMELSIHWGILHWLSIAWFCQCLQVHLLSEAVIQSMTWVKNGKGPKNSRKAIFKHNELRCLTKKNLRKHSFQAVVRSLHMLLLWVYTEREQRVESSLLRKGVWVTLELHIRQIQVVHNELISGHNFLHWLLLFCCGKRPGKH